MAVFQKANPYDKQGACTWTHGFYIVSTNGWMETVCWSMKPGYNSATVFLFTFDGCYWSCFAKWVRSKNIRDVNSAVLMDYLVSLSDLYLKTSLGLLGQWPPGYCNASEDRVISNLIKAFHLDPGNVHYPLASWVCPGWVSQAHFIVRGSDRSV